MTMLCVLRRSTARLNASMPSIISRSYSASSTTWNHSFSFLKDKDPIECNISESIASKIGINLHQKPDHPICIIKKKIESYFNSLPKFVPLKLNKFVCNALPVMITAVLDSLFMTI